MNWSLRTATRIEHGRAGPRRGHCLPLLLAIVAVAIFLPPLAATPLTEPAFYRVVQADGTWWFESPVGKRFFSLGVNVVNTGAEKSEYNAARPEYASFLYYPTTDAWANATLKRLESWNFNTIGGWSNPILRGRSLPYTIVLGLGESVKAPWGDLFSPASAQAFDEVAKRTVLQVREDPSLLGYFSDNELGWWDETLLLYFIKQPASNHTHQRLLELLRTHYNDQFAALKLDFNVEGAKTFEELGQQKTITLRAGGHGVKVINEFVQLLAERYYQLAHDSIRRYDQHHLILGDRFAAWYPQAVARAARNYVDVISINSGADWPDGELSPFVLKTLHSITGKPVLVSEFYMCARENRSGNKNSGAIFPTVRTQRERAAAFRTNLQSLAELPFVIGAHWFQYSDEPTYGRPDGEDYNMGLVDIHDKPYQELTAAAAALDVNVIHRGASESPDLAAIPVYQLANESEVWNRRPSLVTGTNEPAAFPFADLYAAWDRKFLYLVLYTADYVDLKLHPGKLVPRSHAMEWTISTGSEARPVRVRFGSQTTPVVESGKAVIQAKHKSTRFMVVLKVPAASLGHHELSGGKSITLQSALSRRNGLNRMHWSRVLRLEARPASPAE